MNHPHSYKHTNLIFTDSYNLTDFRHDFDTDRNNAKHFNVSYKTNRKETDNAATENAM